MSQVGGTYTVSTSTDLSFKEAVARVREQLAAEGFGVLCEIDVQATLKQKLGADRGPYLILGACNPALAHRALEAEPELGVLLPCNVVIYQEDGQTRIAAVDAEQMLSIVGNDELAPTATKGPASPRRCRRSRRKRMTFDPTGHPRQRESPTHRDCTFPRSASVGLFG